MHRLIVLLCAFALLFPLSGRARRDTQVEFVTTAGNFTVRLLRDTPIHSRHFEQLVRAGYYNGLLFHRVIRDFMIQAGDSTSRNAAPACSWEKPIAKKPSRPKSISPITTTAAGRWPWRASRTR